MQFPRLVYKSASNHELVEDAEQYDAAINAGWFDSVPDALTGKKEPKKEPVKEDAPTREELETKAKELGIEFDGRIGDKKLNALIEAKLAEA